MENKKEQHVDNAKWVKENAAILFPKDPNRTFEVVTKTHPLMGMAAPAHVLNSKIRLIKYMSLERLATYADAVAVCCYEVLGIQEPPEVTSKSNLTALGAYAWIAIHHSDANIRQQSKSFLQSKTSYGKAKKLLK